MPQKRAWRWTRPGALWEDFLYWHNSGMVRHKRLDVTRSAKPTLDYEVPVPEAFSNLLKKIETKADQERLTSS